ncbi:uncharacterized protein LOC144113988 [Amblyomma americanum]
MGIINVNSPYCNLCLGAMTSCPQICACYQAAIFVLLRVDHKKLNYIIFFSSLLCSTEDDISFKLSADEAGESSTQAVEGLPEALPQASGCDVEGETWAQECSPDVYEPEAAQLPPAKRPRMSQKQTAENPGNAGDENILQACVSHLSTIREQRERQQKDDIALFCMLLDSRLRRLPRQVAEDFMHNIEMMTYDVMLQARTEV